MPVLNRITPVWEIVFVDDGSRDDTLALVKAQSLADPRIGAVSFSRNFGKEVAIAAGLDHVRGDAVVIMDADLQHPPEMIEAFVEKWREGYLMVYGQRTDRSDETRVKRGFAHLFYRLFSRFGEISLPEGAGDFRLIDRKGVEVLRTLGEKARFSKGLYAWIGFKNIGVPFVVEDRLHGATQMELPQALPVRLRRHRVVLHRAVAGLDLSRHADLDLLHRHRDLLPRPHACCSAPICRAFPSLIVSLTFFSGVQLLSLGIIGEYVGRIFAEVKRRPLYVVAERIGTAAEVSNSLVQDDPRLRRA